MREGRGSKGLGESDGAKPRWQRSIARWLYQDGALLKERPWSLPTELPAALWMALKWVRPSAALLKWAPSSRSLQKDRAAIEVRATEGPGVNEDGLQRGFGENAFGVALQLLDVELQTLASTSAVTSPSNLSQRSLRTIFAWALSLPRVSLRVSISSPVRSVLLMKSSYWFVRCSMGSLPTGAFRKRGDPCKILKS